MAPHLDHVIDAFSPERPPVLLLGGINLLRALGLAGIPVVLGCHDPDEPALDSRHCTARVAVPRLEGTAAVDALVGIGRRLAGQCGRRVPLVFGSDEALALVSRHRERLARFFLFLLPDPAVTEALLAKDRFQAFAAARGLPVPRALAFEGDGPGSVRGASGPVVAKPRSKEDWHHRRLCRELFGGDAKALVFPTGAAAAAQASLAPFAGELLFQEYIPGGDECLWSYHGFADESGQVLAGFVGRKVRTYPVDDGESACIELAEAPELEALGRGIARRCPLRGPFKMDFKRDPRDGRFHLLEINARASLWHYVGAANGVNLMKVTCDYLLDGVAPAPRSARTTTRWVNLGLDAKAFRQLRARHALGWPGWIASIARPPMVYGLFAWRDPLPWTRHWTRRIARKLAIAPTRILSAFRPWRSTAS